MRALPFRPAGSGFLAQVAHCAVRVVIDGAVVSRERAVPPVVRVEVEVDPGVAVVVLLPPAPTHPVADLGRSQVAAVVRICVCRDRAGSGRLIWRIANTSPCGARHQ